jgi:predicted DNA-binding mobile mystery protein A
MISSKLQRIRSRLDERLATLKPTDRFDPPPRKWVRAIRDALGMSGVQFARRLNIRPQSVEALEKSEADGTIQLKTLRRAAEALDCTLVYALVPKQTLEASVHKRAKRIAMRALGRASHTMKLEAQETSDAKREEQIETYIREVVKDREIWNES